MKKPTAVLLILYVVAVFAFGTWQLFAGRFEAAFSTLPFLLITYFFVKSRKE